jgi:uncharacterized protein
MVAGLVSSAVTAMAQGPAFDCARAQGEIEQLICKDQALAALDRKLDAVYKAASAKVMGQMVGTLRAEQRGWIKGRDECWKAQPATPTWITASWTVNSVRACVEAQYRIRTSELQAVWRLVTPRTVSFACQDNPANEIVANFFDTDPPTARLERGDRTVTVYQVPAASGAKYEGQNVEFWNKGQEATASWMNPATGVTEELHCKVRP